MAIILQKKFSILNDQIKKYERLNERIKDVNELAGGFFQYTF